MVHGVQFRSFRNSQVAIRFEIKAKSEILKFEILGSLNSKPSTMNREL